MRTNLGLVSVLLLAGFGAGAARGEQLVNQTQLAGPLTAAIAAADEVELIALDPAMHLDKAGKEVNHPKDKSIGSFWILGRAATKDRQEIAVLARTLRESLEQSDGLAAFCFEPRHALRIRRKSGDLLLVVCFECKHGYVQGFPGVDAIYVTRSPEKEWDGIFQKHGLTKAAATSAAHPTP